MKSILILGLCLLAGARGFGQGSSFNDSIAGSRNMITRDAMVTLGSFALANIATGFIIAGRTQGETRAFWRMNGYWNFVNLGVAGLGYLGTIKALHRTYSFSQNEEAQLSIEKTYVLNFGLDLVYIAGGFYLRERGLSESNLNSRDQYRGYGTSIASQGGFLLLMDGVMILLHHRNSIRLNRRLRNLELNAAPGGLGLNYKF